MNVAVGSIRELLVLLILRTFVNKNVVKSLNKLATTDAGANMFFQRDH